MSLMYLLLKSSFLTGIVTLQLQIEEIEEKNCNLSLNIVKYNRLYL